MPKKAYEKGEISSFIDKIWGILQNPEFSHIIIWNNCGKSFTINNSSLLESTLLPNFFRHSKLKSFVRQLNMYGFKKTQRDKYSMVFYHRDFTLNAPERLPLIRRKVHKRTNSLPTDSVEQDFYCIENGISNETQHKESASKNSKMQQGQRKQGVRQESNILIRSYGRLIQSNNHFVPFVSPSSYASIPDPLLEQRQPLVKENAGDRVCSTEGQEVANFWQLSFTSCQNFI